MFFKDIAMINILNNIHKYIYTACIGLIIYIFTYLYLCASIIYLSKEKSLLVMRNLCNLSKRYFQVFF